jgi:CubicO group peptidase (beta-lactamase class C family)
MAGCRPSTTRSAARRRSNASTRSAHPGVAWGVVRDGRLAHAGGAGTIRDAEDRRPDADAVFRIASMTKSFTAAAILLLRDEGLLRLDDPVATYVPAHAGWRPPTTDSPPVTVRHLLTMSAGLPTDDPWGDRQQDLPLDDFERLLASGPSFAWPPGTTFEYSNLGYGILGRVVTAAAGREYREVVADRLLRPLGMASTGYFAEDLPEEHLAHGYVRYDDALEREGTDGYARWPPWAACSRPCATRDVGGRLPRRVPGAGRSRRGHPLRRSTRREMQQLQRSYPPELSARPAHEEPELAAGGYGLGLAISLDPDIGTVLDHGGGYPGFGSIMAWHPATGLGMIALGNLRYAPVRPVVAEQLRALVLADVAPRRRPAPMPAVSAFRPVVERLLAGWDDRVADEAFAMNMDLDLPRDRRRAEAARLGRDLGPLRADDARPVESDSPADLSWQLRGDRGWARVSILVTPEARPRLQRLDVTAVLDPPPSCARWRSGCWRSLSPRARVAADLAVAESFDVAAARRSLRAAGARFGAMRLAG